MFIITVFLSILGLICTDIFVPSLPHIATFFHQTQGDTQLTISLFLAGFAISQLFYGPFSDYYGRRPPLIVGTLLFIAGSVVCIFATVFDWLLVGRVIQGIGVGAGLSLARVILRDCYQGTELAIRSSKVGMCVSLTPALAPFLGGVLQQQFGFRSSFIFMFLYGLLILTLLLFFFKETIHHKNKNLTMRHTVTQYGTLLKNRLFIRYVMTSGLAFSAIILYANIMPFIAQNQLKLSPVENGLVILLAALGICFGSFISSKTVAKLTPEKLVNMSLLSFAIAGFLLILTQTLFGTRLVFLIPLVFLSTISCGIIFPNAIALCFTHIKCNIGIAGAIYGTVQVSIAMITNFLLNTITYQNQDLLGMFYLGIGIIGILLCCNLQVFSKTVTKALHA